MRAEVNDRIVVAGGRVDRAVREGRIVEVQGTDGAPPYLVEWSDGHQGFYYPGPDAHVEAPAQMQAPENGTPPATEPAARARTWSVQVQIFEDAGGATSAHAVLSSGAPSALSGRGEAHRRPDEAELPEIGDEIAVARALHRLADALLSTASDDLTGALGRDVHLVR